MGLVKLTKEQLEKLDLMYYKIFKHLDATNHRQQALLGLSGQEDLETILVADNFGYDEDYSIVTNQSCVEVANILGLELEEVKRKFATLVVNNELHDKVCKREALDVCIAGIDGNCVSVFYVDINPIRYRF